MCAQTSSQDTTLNMRITAEVCCQYNPDRNIVCFASGNEFIMNLSLCTEKSLHKSPETRTPIITVSQSLRLSNAWIMTERKKPLWPENLAQTDRIRAKPPIFARSTSATTYSEKKLY